MSAKYIILRWSNVSSIAYLLTYFFFFLPIWFFGVSVLGNSCRDIRVITYRFQNWRAISSGQTRGEQKGENK